jgi:hypothetical protein
MTRGAEERVRVLPWYAEGLCFECQFCGRCCGGGPGYVWLEESELREIARFLGLPAEDFRHLYVRRLWRGMSLREKENYDCVLLDGNGRCTAYAVRPLQCRVWPFWPSNLGSREVWDEAGLRCPGIGRGAAIDYEQIEAERRKMRNGHW